MDTAIIYGIKNKKTNKYYVGSTRELEIRWKSHTILLDRKEHSPKLQVAWDESHPDDWEWVILEQNVPIIHQFHSEQYWIDTLDAYNNGFNTSPRAGSYICLDKRGYKKIIDEREDDVLEMLTQIESGVTYRKIASNFGVSLGFLTKTKERNADLLSNVIEAENKKSQRVRKNKAEAEHRKKSAIERDRKIAEMLQSHRTYRDIAHEVGCALGTVHKVAKRIET